MLVIIEGVDGTGKTTLIEGLKRFFFRPIYIINYSYPTGWHMNIEAGIARGEYLASIRIFKEILSKQPDAIIICDRFHLGEYAYGPVKRGYPEWLAEKTFEIEDELIKELGKENIRLIVMGMSKPEIALERSNRKGEYLKELDEYKMVNNRYGTACGITKLPYLVVHADIFSRYQVLDRVINFITEEYT